MKYNTQRNSIWKNEVMTQQVDMWKDTLGEYGCLITCLANIIQERKNFIFTPKNLNDVLVKHQGYKYLYNSSTPENQASFLRISIIKEFFGIEYKKISKYENQEYCIAMIKNKYSYHFMNIIQKVNKKILCFNVWNGELKYYDKEDILKYYQVTSI